MKTVIRKLGEKDAASFRALRLEAMKDVPHAFGATPADEKGGLKVGGKYYDEDWMQAQAKG